MISEFVAHYNKENDLIQTVEEHLINTAMIAENITQKIGCRNLGLMLGLLHDLGKYTDAFNHYIQYGVGLIQDLEAEEIGLKGSDRKIDHASAGAIVSNECLTDGEISRFITSFAIKCHHGGLRDVLNMEGPSEMDRLNQKTEAETRKEEALRNFMANDNLYKIFSDIDYDQMEEDLKRIASRIMALQRGDDTAHKSMAYFQLGLLMKYSYSALIDADRLDTADFQDLNRQDLRNTKDALTWHGASHVFESYISEFKADTRINKVRHEISEACFKKSGSDKGIFRLQVPTGGGKTLAAMRFALNHASKHGMDHIFIIIPYTSIIDQNADVYRNIFEEKAENKWSVNMILEHHGNLTDDEKSEMAKLLNENWDAPIIITTMVQFLESVFSGGTSGIRRMHALANSVLIFDEIQLIPPKTMVMFNGLIQFLTNICGSSVVLSTATQPLLDMLPGSNQAYNLRIDSKNDIIQDPVALSKSLKRVSVVDYRKVDQWSLAEMCGFIKECHDNHGSVLVIVNTKKSAKDLFEKVASWDGVSAFHLSTDMCPAHRRRTLGIMNKLLEDSEHRNQVFCISTQLIEAGIDVDFDVGIRYLAGMDSIVQAAGRINRHGLRESGTLYIVNPIENIDMLKHIKSGCSASNKLLDVYKTMPERFSHDLLSIEAMDAYYKYYYHEIKSEMLYVYITKEGEKGLYNLFDLYGYNGYHRTTYENQGKKLIEPFNMAFKTAGDRFSVIEGLQVGVLVPYDQGKDYINEISDIVAPSRFFSVKSRLQQYMINIYRNKIGELIERGVVYQVDVRLAGSSESELMPILCLNDNYYDQDLGYVQEAGGQSYIID